MCSTNGQRMRMVMTAKASAKPNNAAKNLKCATVAQYLI